MKVLFRTTLLLLVLLSSLGRPAHAAAQTGTVVRVSHAVVELEAAQTATIEIWVDDVAALYGFELEIHYNPAKISAASTALGDFLDGPGLTQPGNGIDNVNGVLRYGMVQMSPSEAKSGSGMLIRFEITLLEATSETPLVISSILLTDRNGCEIPCEAQDGIVKSPGDWEVTYLPLVLR